MTKSLLFAIGLLFVTTFQVAAQAPAPPNVLLIVREEIKPGMIAAHAREANNVVRIYSKAKSPYNRLAMVPVAGNENEVTYLWPFASFAELEKSNKDLDSISNVTYKSDFDKIRPEGDDDYHTSQRDSIAVFRNDLSYNAGADMPRMRYMRVQTVRVKPGHARDFEEARRMVKAAHEKAKIDENMAVYQVVGGAQSGTYLIFIPWDSLSRAETLPHGKAYQDAIGDDRRDKMEKIESDSVVFSATEIYAFAPQLSFSPGFAAADPAFWTLKPMASESPAPTAVKSRQKTMGKKP